MDTGKSDNRSDAYWQAQGTSLYRHGTHDIVDRNIGSRLCFLKILNQVFDSGSDFAPIRVIGRYHDDIGQNFERTLHCNKRASLSDNSSNAMRSYMGTAFRPLYESSTWGWDNIKHLLLAF